MEVMRSALRFSLVCTVALVATFACRSHAVPAGAPMTATAEPPRALHLTDEQLFADPFTPPSIEFVRQLRDRRFQGLDLQAPAVVDTTKHDTLPIVLLEAVDGRRQWDVNTEVNSILVALDLVSGAVRTANLYQSNKRYDPSERPRSRQGSPAGTEGVAAIGADAHDAQRLLDLPWHAGRYALAVLEQDWRTNVVHVELTGGEMSQPKEVQLTVEQARQLAERQTATGLPTFAKRPDSPPIPVDGIALSLRAKPNEPLVAAGSFRLKAPPRTLLTKDLTDWLAAKAAKTPVPRALVPVTLLVLVRDEGYARTLDLQVPVYELENGVGEAYFATDLRAGMKEPLPSGDHHVWAVAADRVFGPFPLTIP